MERIKFRIDGEVFIGNGKIKMAQNAQGKRVLIVDDEPLLLHVIEVLLKIAGYDCISTVSAHRAIELLSSSNCGIDLLITDVVMPDLFGDQLATVGREIRPKLKCLFMSGNPPGSLEPTVKFAPGVNFLKKPFTSEDLYSAVEQALQNESSLIDQSLASEAASSRLSDRAIN